MNTDVIQLIDSLTKESVNFNRIDKLPSGAKLDGVIYAIKNGVYYRRVIENEINVRWFGAKGDGISDDTVSIQKAFDFLLKMRNQNENNSDKNLCCFIPDGKYKITETLRFPTSCCLKGSSKNGTILFTERNDITLLYPSDNGDLQNTWSRNKDYTILSDLTIAGNHYTRSSFDWKAYPSSSSKGVFVDHTTKISFQNVCVNGFETCGIHVNESYYITLDNVILLNNCAGLMSHGGTSIFAVNSEFRVNSIGVKMYNTYACNFTNCLLEINYCNFYPELSYDVVPEHSKGIAVYLNGNHNINFTNCYFEAHLVSLVLHSSWGNVFTNCFFCPSGDQLINSQSISPQFVWFYGHNSSGNKFINNYYESSNEPVYNAHSFFTHHQDTSTGNVFELLNKTQLDLFISQNQGEFNEFINNNRQSNAPVLICAGSNEQFINAERRFIAEKKYGTTSERPTQNLYKGQSYFDSTLGNVIFWNGVLWVTYDGSII